MMTTQWSSNDTWNEGGERTIKKEGPDRCDKRFVAKQLDDDGYFKIRGDGTAEFKGKGRLYVLKEDEKAALDKKEEYLWEPNLEVSCDIKVDSIGSSDDDDDEDDKKKKKRNDDDDDDKKKKKQAAFINVGGCTNHFAPHKVDKEDDDEDDDDVINSNGRNYSIRAFFSRGFVGYEKETVHGVYDKYEAKNYEQDEMPLSKWFTYKFKQTVDGKDVKLDGSIKEEGHDEISFDTFTDKGQMTKLNKEDFEKEKDHKKVHKILQRVIKEEKGVLYERMTKKNQVWTAGAYSGLYIRLTGMKKVYIKNLTVKEI